MESYMGYTPFVKRPPGFMPKDRAYLWPLVEAYAKGLADPHAEVKEVRVFGDFLDPGARFYNFIDLLVILDRCDIPIKERPLHYLGHGFRFGVALYPLTRTEIDQEVRKGNTALQQALSSSRRVYP